MEGGLSAIKGAGLTGFTPVGPPSEVAAGGGAGLSESSSPTSPPRSTWHSLRAKGKADLLQAGSQLHFYSSV